MATAALNVTIQRPVSDVFAVLTHLENAATWSRAIEETVITPGPMGVGTRRRAIVPGVAGRTMENVMELTEFEPDRRLAMRSVSGLPFEVRIAIDLVPVGDGCRLDWVVSFAPGGILRPIGPLLAGAYKRTFSKDLAKLKAMMESGEL